MFISDVSELPLIAYFNNDLRLNEPYQALLDPSPGYQMMTYLFLLF